MVSLPQRLLAGAVLLVSFAWAADAGGSAIRSNQRKFRTDDPLWQEPRPRPVSDLRARNIDPLYDFVTNSFSGLSNKGRTNGAPETAARDLNTLGEVPDSPWFTNRHGRQRLSREELVRGPGNTHPPSKSQPWHVVAAKSDGVTPGFTITDAQGNRYLLKLDPPRNPELASAADVIGSKAFYALGYWTPENYIVHFRWDQVVADSGATYRDPAGHKRPLTEAHLTSLLHSQPANERGEYRALASRIVPGKLLGPFSYRGTRSDDPNDVVPHEDRRELRGMAVMAAWLNHTDAKSINTMDSLVQEQGRGFVRHYLIDFGASLGSDSFAAKDARSGHEYFVDPMPTARQILTLGFAVPRWARVRYPESPTVGRFSSEGFEPDKWKPNYPNPAFTKLQPEDAFWAAKIVMAFSDDDIRALVSTGEYSDPSAAEYVARTLIQRRDAIGRTYLKSQLALDRFTVTGERLAYTDLKTEYGLGLAQSYAVSWALFDNESGQATPIESVNDFRVPDLVRAIPPRSYASATIRPVQPADSQHLQTTVFLRREAEGWTVAGVERTR